MCTNAYIWNLERWYRWTYFQGSDADADVGKGLVDAVGEGEGGTNWESSKETCLNRVWTVSQWGFAVWRGEFKPSALWQPGEVGGRFQREGAYVCERSHCVQLFETLWTVACQAPLSMGFSRQTYVYLWLIHVDVWHKPTQYCKAIIFQLKKKNLVCVKGIGPLPYLSALSAWTE